MLDRWGTRWISVPKYRRFKQAARDVAADSTGGNAHQDLVRTRNGGGKIRDVELIVLRKKKSLHSGPNYLSEQLR